MTLLLSIIAFFIIFSVLILVHEAGHYFAALKMGVKVEEFGFGLPPRIWGKKGKKSGTIFSFNAIPFGGFVRLYGEDKMDDSAIKSPKSFASKTPWQKIVVVVAGVLMNFLLAYLLLVFGLVIGMQPLITNQDQIYQGINDGLIEADLGLKVKNVRPESAGLFEKDDKILAIDEKQILLGDELARFEEGKNYQITVLRSGSTKTVTAKYLKDKPWFDLYDPVFLPKVALYQVAPDSVYGRAGLRDGDLLLKVNGQEIFSFEALDKALEMKEIANVEVARGEERMLVNLELPAVPKIIITAVLVDSPAQKAGLLENDEVLKINDQKIVALDDLKKILGKKDGKPIRYLVHRNGVTREITIAPDGDGMVGVLLAELSKENHPGVAYYLKTVPYSILKINDLKLSLMEAPGRAWYELYNLSGLTAQMFGGVLQSIVTKFKVPDGVAGPVGIAQMTYQFVQEGFMSLIRFTALLSLSLGIINILPFPGLDGGRLILILFSMLIGRKLNPRWEGLIHIIGFFLLLLLIFIITFNDLVKLFSSI